MDTRPRWWQPPGPSYFVRVVQYINYIDLVDGQAPIKWLAGSLGLGKRPMLGAMTARRGAPVRLLDEDEKIRLAEIRDRSVERWQQHLAAGPDDPLGALAWLVGLVGPTPPDSSEMQLRIDRAKRAGFTWRQIADALGEGDTPEAGRRVRDRRKAWD